GGAKDSAAVKGGEVAVRLSGTRCTDGNGVLGTRPEVSKHPGGGDGQHRQLQRHEVSRLGDTGHGAPAMKAAKDSGLKPVVQRLQTWTALPITSAGRRSPLHLCPSRLIQLD